jgi:uncharacterized protein YbaP (TraB family)
MIDRRWLALGFLFCLFPWQSAGAEENGLLWRIEKPGQAPSCLFGTIHSADPRVLELPLPVAECLDSSERLVLEAEIDGNALHEFATDLFLAPPDNLLKRLGPQDFVKLFNELSKRGATYEMALRFKPWVAMLFLNQPPDSGKEFLDLRLKARAEQQGKAVHGLETLGEQARVFDVFSLEQQLDLLRSSLKYMDRFDEMMEQLHLAYLAGDLQRLERLSEEYTPAEDRALADLFMHHLLGQRNQRMLARMGPHLADGPAFIAVGALHLPGDEGLIALLRDAGYRVSALGRAE